MAALIPGMIEFVSDEGRAAAAAALRYNRWIDQNPNVDYGKNPHFGDLMATQDRVQQRGIAANKMGWPFGKKARARRVERKTYNEDIDYINNQLKGMSALTPGMVAFALGEDNRPRNNNGQFLANETGGADPNSMAAAYGNVEAEKMARRQNLMGRLKAMMGR
jgi:hypothetical protein